MRRLSVGFVFGLAAVPACTSAWEAPRVSIDTGLVAPKSLLDRVSTLALTVHEGNAACDEATGALSFPGGAGAATELARVQLGSSGCTGGARFCGAVTIEKSTVTRYFAADARDASGTTLALGCATAVVDRDALPLSLRLLRYLEPAVCGDGVVQPTEQCEPGGTATCDDACQSRELLVSSGSSQNGTSDGAVGDKTDPFFLWPSQSGSTGRFFAFFTDRAISGNNVEVGLRALGADLTPLTSPPALAAGSIFLPNGTAFPPSPSPRQQSMPQAAFLDGKYYVVFQDDDTAAGLGLDVHLRSMDSALVADQGAAPLGINGPSGAGEAAIQGAPAIAAGPSGRLYIAWEDAGKIAGRTLRPPSTLGNQNELSAGSGNAGVSVVTTPTGWVAVWQSGTGTRLRVLNDSGTPQGAEQAVNQEARADRARAASLPDGRFAVTWSAGGAVFVQRYDASGVAIDDDAAIPIGGDGASSATIASTPAAGGSYVVAWLEGDGHVYARMLGGTSGFLYNHVDGQSGAFQASQETGRSRGAPFVAAGGSGPFVAIGWEDRSDGAPGIVVRRFPLPAE